VHGSRGWEKGNPDPEDSRAFEHLSKKFEGTPWEAICQKLSEKAKTP
jgi:hypothetical protein